MRLPYFPMFPADFEAKTSHLTLEEDGAYNRLLRLAWMTPGCSLPADAPWIARRMRVDMATYERVVQPIIAEFFRRRNGRFFNQRLSEIRAETDEKHLRRVEAGKKGGRQLKSPENNNFGLSNAKAMLKQPEPEPEPEPDKEESSKKEEGSKSRAKRLSATWRLPQEWGKWALDQGMAEARVRTEADKFRDYWMAKAGAGGLKRDWLATWRNWIRTAMERGQHEKPSQQAARFKAFLAGATITPPMDSGSHSDTSQPLLARR